MPRGWGQGQMPTEPVINNDDQSALKTGKCFKQTKGTHGQGLSTEGNVKTHGTHEWHKQRASAPIKPMSDIDNERFHGWRQYGLRGDLDGKWDQHGKKTIDVYPKHTKHHQRPQLRKRLKTPGPQRMQDMDPGWIPPNSLCNGHGIFGAAWWYKGPELLYPCLRLEKSKE